MGCPRSGFHSPAHQHVAVRKIPRACHPPAIPDVAPIPMRKNTIRSPTFPAWQTAVRINLVRFNRFSSDLTNHTLPEYSFIVPNLLHDAHDGSLSAADSWPEWNIAP